MKTPQLSTQLVTDLELIAHPEGGFYKRIYSSEIDGTFWQDGKKRSLQTAIFYLLTGNDFSSFHRIRSDEIWFLGQANTEIRIIELSQGSIIETVLSHSHPAHCVKANTWFAAELVEKESHHYALAYCTVAPGFDFDDFEMASSKTLIEEYPHAENATKSVMHRLCRSSL